MYISNILGGRAPNLDLDDIMKIIKTTKGGTLPEDVRNMNTNKVVRNTIPSLEFDVDLRMHGLSEIEEEIRADRPVIAWVTLTDKVHRCAHAIVVTDIDRENDRIYYNDPIYGKKEEGLPSFIARWESEDRLIIKIKIGQVIQKLLDEYQNQ